MVAAPDVNNTTGAMESEAAERMDMCNSEPSESGEIPLMELTMVQRAEVRQGKRAREPAVVAGALDQVQTWSVPRIKDALEARGLCMSGLKRDLVLRLATAMAHGEGGEREEARPRICMRER